MECPKCKRELSKKEYSDDFRMPELYYQYYCRDCNRYGLILKNKER